MRHRAATFKINRSSSHVRSLLANAVCSLIEHGKITTTLVRAKRIRQLAEQMFTKAKQGDLHSRRLVLAKLHQEHQVARLFDEIAPKYKNRQGGYTRIYKLGPRIGDAAEMSILSLVETDEELAARAAASTEAAPAEVAQPEEEAK